MFRVHPRVMLLAIAKKTPMWRKVDRVADLVVVMLEGLLNHWFRVHQPLELDSRLRPVRRHGGEKFRRRLCFRRVCYMLVLLAVTAVVALVGSQSAEG